jgi:glucokinase
VSTEFAAARANGFRITSSKSDSDFAPTDRRQIRLLEFLLWRFDHVAVEPVGSGIGGPNICEYFRDEEKILEKARGRPIYRVFPGSDEGDRRRRVGPT